MGSSKHRPGRGPVAAALLALTVAGACTSDDAELDVATSVLSIDTTTTTTVPAPVTTAAPPDSTTTLEPGPEAIVPDTATVVPLRVLRLADDDGTRRARVEAGDIIEWVMRANEVFSAARFGLSYDPAAGMVDVDDSVLNGWSGPGDPRLVERVVRGNEVASAYPGELVVMFRRGPATGAAPAGFATHHSNFVALGEPASHEMCGENDPYLLAHWVGRHLALPPTFAASYPSVEAAVDALADAGQDRAVFDGDGFEATPPDPGVHAVHQCSGEATVRIGGLEFELPRDNLMSLYPERSSLTLDQIDRARWMLAVRLANAMAAPSNTPAPGAAEAEDVLVGTVGRCGLPATQEMGDHLGYQWVDGDHLHAPAEEDCSLLFGLPIEGGGTYEVVLLATRGPDHGAIEVSVGGEVIHFEDLYAPVVLASGPIVAGEVALVGTTVTVQVEVVGSNADSSGTSIGVDGILLRP